MTFPNIWPQDERTLFKDSHQSSTENQHVTNQPVFTASSVPQNINTQISETGILAKNMWKSYIGFLSKDNEKTL